MDGNAIEASGRKGLEDCPLHEGAAGICGAVMCEGFDSIEGKIFSMKGHLCRGTCCLEKPSCRISIFASFEDASG